MVTEEAETAPEAPAAEATASLRPDCDSATARTPPGGVRASGISRDGWAVPGASLTRYTFLPRSAPGPGGVARTLPCDGGAGAADTTNAWLSLAPPATPVNTRPGGASMVATVLPVSESPSTRSPERVTAMK